ncbi:putative membrane protein [Proteus phage SJ_PmiM]|nr:putative membrane protein [Proteus phage SJ_PmiM]
MKLNIGFLQILTLIFVVLKLVGTIAWSWWWVLAPLWIGAGIWLLVFIITVVALSLSK